LTFDRSGWFGGLPRIGAMSRPARTFALLLSIGVAATLASASSSSAQSALPAVHVVKVKGAVDPPLSAYVRDVVAEAERSGAALLVLEMDSRGSYGQEAERLGETIRSATIPVVAWIGPSGARVEGGALFVAYSAGLVAMAPGAGIGPARPFDLAETRSGEDAADVVAASDRLVGLAPGAGASADGVRSLVDGPALPAGPAIDRGAVALAAVNVTDLVKKLDGRSVRTPTGTVVLHTVAADGTVSVSLQFHDIGLLRRLLHAVATPTAVYVLLVLGVWALAFELTQPGFGMAGVGGLVFLVLASYGLTVIPVRWFGLALILAGMGLQGLDVVVRRLGLLTVAGTAAFVLGSELAWWAVAPAIDLSWWLVALFTVAGVLLFGFGMTVALRSRERVRTAQVGLVGLVGEVRSDLNPEGGVFVKGTIWRARSMNGPIPKGTRVRIRGIDGLILRVEPEAEGE
jgi:membrane-bound serine protease (ClpP class)